MSLKVYAQPRTAESEAATAVRRSAVDLRHFCGLTPAGFRLLSFMAVSLCFSLHYACAQSKPDEQATPSVEGPNHTYLSASPSSDAISPSSLARQYAFGSWVAFEVRSDGEVWCPPSSLSVILSGICTEASRLALLHITLLVLTSV
jgi:hypothetical protein